MRAIVKSSRRTEWSFVTPNPPTLEDWLVYSFNASLAATVSYTRSHSYTGQFRRVLVRISFNFYSHFHPHTFEVSPRPISEGTESRTPLLTVS